MYSLLDRCAWVNFKSKSMNVQIVNSVNTSAPFGLWSATLQYILGFDHNEHVLLLIYTIRTTFDVNQSF